MANLRSFASNDSITTLAIFFRQFFSAIFPWRPLPEDCQSCNRKPGWGKKERSILEFCPVQKYRYITVPYMCDNVGCCNGIPVCLRREREREESSLEVGSLSHGLFLKNLTFLVLCITTAIPTSFWFLWNPFVAVLKQYTDTPIQYRHNCAKLKATADYNRYPRLWTFVSSLQN